MKVLLVLAQPPLPQGGAAGRCAWALLKGLREHGLEVRALAARRPYAPAPPAGDSSIAVEEVMPHGPSLPERLRRLRRPRSELAGAFAARVRAEARAADLLHLDELETSWCAVPGKPRVLHLHYLIEEDRDRGTPWQREFWTYLEERLAQRQAFARHDELVANSPQMADRLRRYAPRARVTVVPLSLDPAEYKRASLDGAHAGLIGTLDWPPTKDAIGRLLRETWPAIRRAAPESRLVIGGRGTERLAAEGAVDVLGPIASSAEFFESVSVLLYPVARGSGMKVKVLEAMAAGVPVVTTTAGAEGIAANAGVVVADRSTEFVRAAAELLHDRDARTERGQAGFECFTARYAPRPATEALLPLYASMIGAAAPHRTGAQRASSSQ